MNTPPTIRKCPVLGCPGSAVFKNPRPSESKPGWTDYDFQCQGNRDHHGVVAVP